MALSSECLTLPCGASSTALRRHALLTGFKTVSPAACKQSVKCGPEQAYSHTLDHIYGSHFKQRLVHCTGVIFTGNRLLEGRALSSKRPLQTSQQ